MALNVRSLKRDPAKVKASLVTRSDSSVVTKTGCKIYFPTRFTERFLAQVGVDNLCVGLFAIVVDDQYYSLFSVNSMIGLSPVDVNQLTIDSMDYHELVFDPGSVVITSLELVQNDEILYRLYDELFSKGKVPWYVGYEDLGNVYDTAARFAGANVGENPEVIQLLTSLITRNKDNRVEYYRSVVEKRSDLVDNPPAYIPLRSVFYAATNTTNKLAGSYFSDGVTSALLSPSDRVEAIEKLLKA